ncbi:MAG: NAD(P)H-hydrate dehydratase, partial [Proteobacteria bacterium]|nr:NAD(P)H-hydrate dehydratase [Pseudomonadota bacterium]
NGGDGYLLAAGAKKLGYGVRMFTFGSPASRTAQSAQQQAFMQGLECEPISENIESCFDAEADLIVDALFGHGLERDIGAPLSQLFERINLSSVPVFALDMPSGINSDTGAILGIAIKADATICFVAPKIGLLTGDGADYCGALYYDTLGIPHRVSQQVRASCQWLDEDFIKRVLPVPKTSSHKGDFGHVAIVGGQPGMPGAVILAALAATRSGVGRVTVVSSETHVHLIPLASPVLMTLGICNNAHFKFPGSVNAVCIGPGLGTDSGTNDMEPENWSRAVYDCALDQATKANLPLLLDADGLNLLASGHCRYENWILSPHPKEAARLLGCSVKEIQSNRPQACQRIAEQYGGVCVLKGQGSLVAQSSGVLAVCTQGNWGMATAGSGDVLSGMIVAMLGQGLPLYEAACAAVYLHAKTGDLVAEEKSKRGMVSSDIIEHLPELFKQLEADGR